MSKAILRERIQNWLLCALSNALAAVSLWQNGFHWVAIVNVAIIGASLYAAVRCWLEWRASE